MSVSLLTGEEQMRKDNEHLNLLSIFHFVVGGLFLIGILFLVVHYVIMDSIFSHPEHWKTKGGDAPPPEFFHAFIWFYFIMGVAFLLGSVLNVVSGIFLRQKRYRTFSLVVAALDCVQIPFGTVLGVFTLIVLIRDSVRKSYVA